MVKMVRCWLHSCLFAGLTAILLMLCIPISISTGDVYGTVDICGELPVDSTEDKLLQRVFTCFPKNLDEKEKDCNLLADCVTAEIIQLTESYPCQSETNTKKEKTVLDECNVATAAFVLTESLRKLMQAAVTINPQGTKVVRSSECERKTKLRLLASACTPNNLQPEYYAHYLAMDGATEDDARVAFGYDALMRSVSRSLGKAPPVAEQMQFVKKQKLWQGAFAILITFSCPGLLAVCSPAHSQLISSVQMLGMLLISFYVLKTHGLLLALASALLCIVVLTLQFSLIALLNRRMDDRAAAQAHRIN